MCSVEILAGNLDIIRIFKSVQIEPIISIFSFLTISRFLKGILIEHIGMKNSLEFNLQIGYMFSVEILSGN